MRYRKTMKIIETGWYFLRKAYSDSFIRYYLRLRTHFSKTWACKKNNKEVIISVTSYPDREKQFLVTLESILRQSFRPDRIIVWLADNQYPNKVQVERTYRSFIKRGVEIKFCEDLRSHKKYYWSILENPDAVVITLDDDVYYPKDTVKRLIEHYDGSNGVIISNIARIINIREKTIQPYASWESVQHLTTESDRMICPIGVGGILYSPHSLDHQVFNKEDIMSLCKHTDDLWLNAMARLNKSRIICIGEFPTLITVKGSQTNSLGKINVMRNNTELSNIVSRYPDSFGGFRN